jgi:hypothetical protein
MVEFLDATQITSELKKLITNSKEMLFLITPYIKLSDRLKMILNAADSTPNIRITFICRKDASNNLEDLNFLQQKMKHAQIFECKNLHAKCYINENTAIIASMNLYQFSQEQSLEMGIKIDKNTDTDLAVYNHIMQEVMLIEGQSTKLQYRTISDEEPSNVKSKQSIESNKKTDTQKKSDTSKSITNGYCIRCRNQMELNPNKPLCSKCYPIWAKYSDKTYQEKYCHVCGKESKQSVEKSVCYTCYKKLYK